MSGTAGLAYHQNRYVEPMLGREHSTEFANQAAIIGSQQLHDSIQALFWRWERENGFRHGAAQILLPAGWRES